ncbi:ATP-binding protein [Ruminococcus sp.]|uniref:ATP-binding protein n=1 Tax=Ruminococcus sp. TaxID=41978 RepID=UPI0025F52142|nr:ATP-binding protein [Ruminococcus sp.]
MGIASAESQQHFHDTTTGITATYYEGSLSILGVSVNKSRRLRINAAATSKSHFGLGLSIAKELVELHHGTISVYDTDGGGVTFRVTFPK